jgi:hypothetical protein
MDEMDLYLKPSLDAALSEFFGKAQPDPDFASHLESTLLQRQKTLTSFNDNLRLANVDARRSSLRPLFTRPVLIVIIAILVLLALTGVAYALGRLTGFMPGFGFTTENNLVYVLAEPAKDAKGNITLNLEKAVNDQQSFWVELTVDGLNNWNGFSQAYVVLPNGEKIRADVGGSSEPAQGEIKLSYLFAPLDRQPQELTLLIQGLSEKDFSLPLRLRQVETGELVPISPEWNMPLQSEIRNGVRLVLDHVAVDSQQTVFQVSLRFDQPNTWLASPWNVTLSDTAGRIYPLNDVTPDTMASGNTRIYQTLPFRSLEQLDLTVATFPDPETLSMFIDLSGKSDGFTFDPGSNPKPGQRWELNQALSAGGFDMKVISASLTDEPGLVFEIESNSDIDGVMFDSPDPMVIGSTVGTPTNNGQLTAGIKLSEIPQRPIELRLVRVYFQAKGPWQIQWQPPIAPTEALESPVVSVTPTMEIKPTPTLPAINPVLLKAQQLALKFDTYLQHGAGWVHITQETTSIPQAGQVFPPPYIHTKEWFEVDSEGYVISSVHTDLNDVGQVIQQAATVGDYSVNFTTGDSGFNNAPRYRFSMYVLTDFLSRITPDDKSHLNSEEKLCANGKSCLIITGWETFSNPIQNPGETEAYSGAGERVWVDVDSGQLIERQTFWLLEDGSEMVSSTTIFSLIEKVITPPQDILDILGRVVLP